MCAYASVCVCVRACPACAVKATYVSREGERKKLFYQKENWIRQRKCICSVGSNSFLQFSAEVSAAISSGKLLHQFIARRVIALYGGAGLAHQKLNLPALPSTVVDITC